MIVLKVVRAKYESLGRASNAEIVECFCKCSVQDNIPPEIRIALNSIVQNDVGKETLRIISARLYPFAECARTLETLVSTIPVVYVSDTEKVSKAKKVVLLLDALGAQNEDVVSCFFDLGRLLEPLKQNPIVFPKVSEKYKNGSLLRVFKGDSRLADKKKMQMRIIDQINLWWDSNVRSVVDGFLPLLRLGMFSLKLGAMQYVYDHSQRQYVISFSAREIVARSLTGPLLIDEIDSVRIPPICCFMDDQEISAPTGLHHEIFHHLVIGLEGDGFASFSRLVSVFLREHIDASYVRYLKEIYTDADEFRTITGLFVNDSGLLVLDPCSEGAYLHGEGKALRGTHKSHFRAVHAPISFVRLLERYYTSVIPVRREKLDHGKIEWCN